MLQRKGVWRPDGVSQTPRTGYVPLEMERANGNLSELDNHIVLSQLSEPRESSGPVFPESKIIKLDPGFLHPLLSIQMTFVLPFFAVLPAVS